MSLSQIEELARGPDIIICRDVHKWFGSYHAVRGITTTIERSQVVVIIGPSGSGKSTFIKTINNMEQHQRGDIIVEGVLLNQDTRNIDAVRRNIGVVSQKFTLFPHLSVMENITLAPVKVNGIRPKEAREKAMEILDRVGMPGQAGASPLALPIGHQRKATIARAMAMEPNIMLFDEPTSSMEAEMVGEIIDIMRELAKSHITMVAITHEMEFAQETADRVILFDEGQIVEDRPPADLFSSPKHPRTRAFLNRMA